MANGTHKNKIKSTNGSTEIPKQSMQNAAAAAAARHNHTSPIKLINIILFNHENDTGPDFVI